jgi:hypothetical protein
MSDIERGLGSEYYELCCSEQQRVGVENKRWHRLRKCLPVSGILTLFCGSDEM